MSVPKRKIPAYDGEAVRGLYDPKLKNAKQRARQERKKLPKRKRGKILGEKAGYDKL
jgi:hypothetical protein